MNYLGGKFRQGKKIAEVIRRTLRSDQWYVEPFCGALGVASRVAHSKMLLSDISQPLITMWKHFQNPKVVLPDVVTNAEYDHIKRIRDPHDWRTAYYGFGMSFGGKYFGGYARESSGKTNYSANLKRSTDLKRSTIIGGDVRFECCSYDQLDIPNGSVIYCDPPYYGRTKGHDFDEFDHTRFWDWTRTKVGEGHVVIVTEFTVPNDFCIVHSFGDTVVRHHSSLGGDGTNEVIVVHESQLKLFE